MKNKIKLASLALVLVFTLQIASAMIITNVDAGVFKPGDSSSITLSIKNNLDDDFEYVKISLNLDNLPFSPYQSGAEYVLDEILKGKTKDAVFRLQASADAKAGIYKIPVKISYNNTIESSYISLTINAKPEIQASSENYLIKGQNNEITIKLVNTGLTDVKFLKLNIQESGFQVIGAKEVYIGDIDSNDFDTASFNIFTGKDIASNIAIPLTITYKDALNKDFTEVEQVSLRAYSTSEAVELGLIKQSNAGTIVIVIIVLIAAYFIYRFVRKRLKKKAV